MKHVYLMYLGDYGGSGRLSKIFRLKKDAISYIRNELEGKYAFRDNRIYECDDRCEWCRIDKEEIR